MEFRLNRRMFLRYASVAGVGLVGAPILAACAPKPAAAPTEAPKQEAPKAEQKPAEAKPAAKEPVTLVLNMRTGGDTGEPAIYVMRPKEFMEDQPQHQGRAGSHRRVRDQGADYGRGQHAGRCDVVQFVQCLPLSPDEAEHRRAH